MANGNNPNDPPEWPERTSLMNITIEVENAGISTKKFKLYPGTEMIYAQKVDAAVTAALIETSVAAYELLKDALEGAPEEIKAEVALGGTIIQ